MGGRGLATGRSASDLIEGCAQDDLAHAFEQHRARLSGIAYRMLGSRADAEDAVQETWLRLARQDASGIDNLAGWLTRVTGRICLDVLRARKVRPELLYDELVPDLEVTQDAGGDPEDDAVVADSVAWALLVVLDSLTPAERLAFVLHDVFAVPFEEVGAVLGRSRNATKMLASRARRKVRGTPAASAAGRQQQREVVDAFLAAARDGDFEALLRVLDPDVTLHIHGTRDVVVKSGATEVAQTFLRGHGRVTARRALVNGEPGVVAWGVRGRPFSVMACTVAHGRLVEIRSLTDRRRLAAMDLPDASRGEALPT